MYMQRMEKRQKRSIETFQDVSNLIVINVSLPPDPTYSAANSSDGGCHLITTRPATKDLELAFAKIS
jgi:hypothetical protein